MGVSVVNAAVLCNFSSTNSATVIAVPHDRRISSTTSEGPEMSFLSVVRRSERIRIPPRISFSFVEGGAVKCGDERVPPIVKSTPFLEPPL